MILWSYHRTGKFPRNHRFVLGERGHQTILGLNRVVLSLRALRRLGRPFQPQLPLPVEAIPLLVDA